jgi:parallel beta-helix repeat protein
VSIVSNIGTNARNSQIIGNLISANSEEGVGIFSSDGNLIKDNLIGTDINGNASFGNGNLGGRGIGVGIGGGPGGPVSNGNRVEDNIVADNSLSGVVVSGGVSNSINRNRIFSNGGLEFN